MAEILEFSRYRPCRCGAQPPKIGVAVYPGVGAYVQCFDCDYSGPLAKSGDVEEALRRYNLERSEHHSPSARRTSL